MMANQLTHTGRPVSLATKISKELMCSICCGEFREPKLLPCGHSFCLQCIQEHVLYKSVFKCPTCMTEITSPTGGLSEFATDFRVTALQNIVSEQRSGRGQDKCTVHGETQVGYCKVCQEILCGRCIIEHTRQKHEICELQEELNKRKARLVSAIDGKTKDISHYNNELSHTQARQTQLELHLVEIEKSIQEWGEEMHGNVNKTEMSLLEDIQEKVKPAIKICEDRIKAIGCHADALSEAVGKANDINDKMLLENIDSCLSMLFCRRTEIPALPMLSMYKLEKPEITWPILEKLHSFPSKPPRTAKTKGKVLGGSYEVGNRELRRMSEFIAKSSDDKKDPLIKEISISLSGDIIVLDKSNQNLKCFDSSGTWRWTYAYNAIQQKEVPCSIGVFPARLVGVTKQQEEKMDVICIKSGKKLNEAYHGVKCLLPLVAIEGSDVIVCNTSNAQIHIYMITDDSQLTKMGIVPTDDNHPILDCRSCIHLANTVVVTDLKNHAIHSFTLKGQKVFTYSIGQDHLKHPRSICTDYDGNILVADQESSMIIQLTPSGQFIKCLLNGQDGLKNPCAIAMRKSHRMIFVADGYNIKIYQ